MSAPIKPTAAIAVARALLKGLTRDTARVSSFVAWLEGYTPARADDWTDDEMAQYCTHLDALAELCERYRTGDSILKITKGDAGRRCGARQDAYDLRGRVPTRTCELPAGHYGLHRQHGVMWE